MKRQDTVRVQRPRPALCGQDGLDDQSRRLQGHTVWMTLRPLLDVNAQVGHKTVHAAANYTS